jgi:hypothetical protein
MKKPTALPMGANTPALPSRQAFPGTDPAAATVVLQITHETVADKLRQGETINTCSPSHPDAELLALGAEYESLVAASYDWSDDGGMPDEMWARFYEVEDHVTALEPQTLEGVAVKLRMLWCWHIENRTEHRYGAQPDSDDRTTMFWGVIQAVKAMSKRVL